METDRLVEKDGREVNIRLNAKLKVSLQLSPCRIVGSLLILAALYTPMCANVNSYFHQGRSMVPAWYDLIVCRAGVDKTG